MKFNYQESDFFHKTDVPVRFRDLDPLNHVNNAVYSSYFEEARIQFIRTIPEFKHSMENGHSFILVHLDLNYIKPVLYGEQIIVGSSIKSIGNTSVTGIQAIFNKVNGELKAVAETTGVWFNLENNRPAKLPELPNLKDYLYAENNG
ncbi:MAG: thioesterase family protein [Balneolaceae bacterium]